MTADQQIIAKFLVDQPEVALSIIELWEIDETVALIDVLPNEQAVIIVSKMAPFIVGKVIEKISEEKAKTLIELLPLKTSILLLKQVDKSTSERILHQLPTEIAQHISRSLEHSNELVGAHLESNVLTLRNNQKASEALITVKKGVNSIRSNVYVVDADRKLVGLIDLKDLLVADPDGSIDSLIIVITRSVLMGMEMSHLMRNWDEKADHLPVTDSEGVFQGVVSKTAFGIVNHNEKRFDNSAIAAGNALGDLFLIGLTGLFGNTGSSQVLPKKY